MSMLNKIICKPFKGLNWWQKVIGIIIFVPVVIPLAFYKQYITKEWANDSINRF